MIVRAVKTDLVKPGQSTIKDIIDKSVTGLADGSILVITSKIVALCENRTVPAASIDKEKLIRQEADLVMPEKLTGKGVPLTIKDNTLIPAAGVDRSNSNGDYVLWPNDPQKTANELNRYLKQRFGLKESGVIIVDSGAMPLRFGTLGIPLAYSGFSAFRDYTGQKDLFGYPLWAGRANLAGGLAAAAVVVMGEGTEQTPLAIITEAPGVEFKDQEPDPKELADYFVSKEDDRMFSPLLNSIEWQKGGHQK